MSQRLTLKRTVLRYGHNDVLWRILEPVDYTLMELGELVNLDSNTYIFLLSVGVVG